MIWGMLVGAFLFALGMVVGALLHRHFQRPAASSDEKNPYDKYRTTEGLYTRRKDG